MKNKVFHIGAAIIIVASLYIFVINGNGVHDQNEQQPKIIVPETQASEANEVRTDSKTEISLLNTKSNSLVIRKKTNRCGLDVDEMIGLERRINISEMSTKQLQVLEDYQVTCSDWLDQFNSLSNDEQQQIREARKQWKQKYKKYILPEPSLEFTNEVISEINNGISDDSDLKITKSQLIYLLRNDYDLQIKIAEELGTSDSGLILAGATHIATLFLCDFDNSCGPQGNLMTMLCFRSEAACGLSFTPYLQSISTFGQFTDWQNAADALRYILKSDWFKNRLALNP